MNRAEIKPGDMVRICFPAKNGSPAQLSHPRAVVKVLKNGRLKYMSLLGFPMTATSWVRVAPKIEIAKYVLPPESSTARMRMTRQEGSARSYG